MKVNKQNRVITTYLKRRGIDTVLKECGNNLRAFKAHLRRVCNLTPDVKLYDIQKQAKEILNNRLTQDNITCVKAVEDFLRNNFGGI